AEAGGGGAQPEVIVLVRWEAGIEPTQPFSHVAVEDAHDAHRVFTFNDVEQAELAHWRVRRPDRLAVQAAAVIDGVGGDDGNVAPVREELDLFLEVVRLPEVVTVEQRKNLATRSRDARV